ncbi:MAG: hypothetical protein N2652_08730 [Kiritimatiellae bacterium]|nr:hypothetical protein [Kiritimatiellia bacterium]
MAVASGQSLTEPNSGIVRNTKRGEALFDGGHSGRDAGRGGHLPVQVHTGELPRREYRGP